ncbi:MAG: Gfo/Idh/MocA family oxidoreductase, partial [Planctomycetes bacterium]|nr:Gfo/Idh/MocA family oxidoreductase [Planctomycetota bacterium]
MQSNRREFLRTVAAAAASTSLPAWYLAELQAADQAAVPSGDKPAVALVGCGGMGRGDAKNASRFGRIVAVCDVDDRQIDQAKMIWPEAETYKDFRRVMERKDIQVVVCGTVDHWHTLVSLAALRSGKDVYCEKPLTLTIEEGQHLVKAVKTTGRILQTGSQQRSD